MKQFKLSTILLSLIAVVLSGTIFFRLVEGWTWLDSYFFTVITISTVGYGELVPATALGKIGTTFLIFGGLGVFAVAIREFANFHMQKREEHTEWLVGHLGHRKADQDPPAANEDEQPDPH
ncbi:potassium channel family protein [Aliisedimentitalea scapharcae]|uniref:Potassium channel family protein n=1 Tax=Aliisedimentitalea scapharcae TaxID=1524259 RepID=A0ABZ2XPV7_9RHOB|nr:potassium channel family protein [Rhodobacteraceae bacterium M382]